MRVLLSVLLAVLSLPLLAAPQLDKLTLPKGFHIAVYSDQVPNAREIVLVSDDLAGAVYRVTYQP